MSTEQLANPGKAYEVSDELESFFFVIFYEGLHWVTHNKPMDLDVKDIFDQAGRIVKGLRTGGTGKQGLYQRCEALICQELEFTKSKPFTDLIRQLYRLFRSLRIFNMITEVGLSPPQEHSPNVEKLKDCKEIVRLMREAVLRKDWSEGSDKVTEDNYPRKETTDEKDQIGLTYLNEATGTTGIKRGAEEVEGEDGHKAPTKRSGVNY